LASSKVIASDLLKNQGWYFYRLNLVDTAISMPECPIVMMHFIPTIWLKQLHPALHHCCISSTSNSQLRQFDSAFRIENHSGRMSFLVTRTPRVVLSNYLRWNDTVKVIVSLIDCCQRSRVTSFLIVQYTPHKNTQMEAYHAALSPSVSSR